MVVTWLSRAVLSAFEMDSTLITEGFLEEAGFFFFFFYGGSFWFSLNSEDALSTLGTS